MKTSRASGLQIAFFMFAVLLLSVPLGRAAVQNYEGPADEKALIQRLVPFAIFALIVMAFPALRRRAREALQAPISPSKRVEVAIVALSMPLLAMASAGALALWTWTAHGSLGLARMTVDMEAELTRAFSPAGLAQSLVLGAIVAPILEELLCRGFLYRAFEHQWGWSASVFLTSVIFGIYHPYFLNAFLTSIVFVCILRRTRSLRSSIIVHSTSNLMMWWPLMGQFVFPDGSRAPGELATWRLQLACLVVAMIALPAYVWMSRDATVKDASLPK